MQCGRTQSSKKRTVLSVFLIYIHAQKTLRGAEMVRMREIEIETVDIVGKVE